MLHYISLRFTCFAIANFVKRLRWGKKTNQEDIKHLGCENVRGTFHQSHSRNFFFFPLSQPVELVDLIYKPV